MTIITDKNAKHRWLNYLLLNTSFNNNIGLLHGKAAAVAYSYYFNSMEQSKWANNIAFSFLEETLSQINLYTPLTYGGGIAGIGVLLETLSHHGYLQEDPNELLEESEPYLLSAVYGAKLQDISIANGISGLGLYFLNRLQSSNPVQPIQQLRYKEAVIACVNQIDNFVQQIVDTTIDLSVLNGLSGTYLFLTRVNQLNSHQPLTAQLIEKISIAVLNYLNNRPFNWQNGEAYFVLLHCSVAGANEPFKQAVLKSLDRWLQQSEKHKADLDFYNAAFVALWLRLIGDGYGLGKARQLSKNVEQFVSDKLNNNSLSELFPFNQQQQCVAIGLYSGVCGTALPLLSLESGDYRWLSMLGIYLPYESLKAAEHENVQAVYMQP